MSLDESACRVERLSVQNDNGLTTVVLECGGDFSYGFDFRLEFQKIPLDSVQGEGMC